MKIPNTKIQIPIFFLIFFTHQRISNLAMVRVFPVGNRQFAVGNIQSTVFSWQSPVDNMQSAVGKQVEKLCEITKLYQVDLNSKKQITNHK